MFVIRFYAKQADPKIWPEFWQVHASETLEGAIIASKHSLANVFPAAERFEITDETGMLQYVWPEIDCA